MRAIRIAVKTIVPVAAIVALMAVPSMAAADMYWGEYDYAPLGGSPTSENPVTVDVSGTLEVEIVQGITIDATCDVTGEVRLANDWDHPSGSPATNQIVSLTRTGSCAGAWGYTGCQASDMLFQSLPWAGTTDDYMSSFSGVLATLKHNNGAGWCSSGFQIATGGTLDAAVFYSNGSGQGDCIDGLDMYESPLSGTNYPSTVTGTLEFDLDSLEGLSTDDGGPCVTLNYQ